MAKRSPPSTARIESLRARAPPSSANPGPGHRQRRPQAGAGLAPQEPAARTGVQQCVTLGCRPSAWRAVIHWSARRCPPCSCGGKRCLLKVAAGALVGWQLWKPGRKQAARSGRALRFGVLHPPPSGDERHPGNRMAFVCGSLDSGGMAGIAHRAAAMRVTAPPLRVPAGCRNPRCRLRRSAGRPSRRACPGTPTAGCRRRRLGRGWGLLPALGGERQASGVLVPQVALT